MKKVLCTVRALTLAAGLSGCYKMRPSSGGGQTEFTPPRTVNASDIILPEGYVISPVATGLTFPTGVTFDESGRPCVVESGYSYGEVWTTPRLLRVEKDGKATTMAEGGKNGPWTGVAYHKGYFYIAEGGELEGGRILRVSPEGEMKALAEDLPGRGDHHTNGPVIGPDGDIYFGQGVATNSGIVGEDNYRSGWLNRFPDFHDIPCKDITLAGENYETPNILKPESKEKVLTGAFSPFGTRTEKGRIIKGSIPCSGSVMKISPDGGPIELVAWGFRNRPCIQPGGQALCDG